MEENIDASTGCRRSVLGLISHQTAIPFRHLEITFATLRLPTLQAVSDRFGVCRELVGEISRDTLTQLASFKKTYINYSLLEEARGNVIFDLGDKKTIGSLDTVPVSVPSSPYNYQPKYADHVNKFLVGVTHHGYVFHVTGPYTGSSHDDVIADHCRFFKRMADLYPDKTILADGIFNDRRNPNVLIPPNRKATAADPDKAKFANTA